MRQEALFVLTSAYVSTLRQFLVSERGVLRLLPISGGIFAGWVSRLVFLFCERSLRVSTIRQ